MTTGAILRRFTKGCRSKLNRRLGWPGVALDTIQVGVFPFQREAGFAVVKLGQAILTIMAIQTIRTEIFYVLDHEYLIMSPVTERAFLLRCGKTMIGRMAGGAIHRGRVIIDLVADQAKRGQRMVVFFQSNQPWIEISTAVFRMALCAFLDRADFSMDTRLCGDFHFDFRMAVFAEHILGGGHRRVAITARSLEISM
jgi:hypothetical protein